MRGGGRLAVVPAVALAALLVVCSGPQAPTTSHGIPTPLGVEAAVQPSAAAAMDEVTEISLEQFTPLLALPMLAAAARALEDGDPGRAAREVERVMVATPPPGGELLRWEFLRGRLAEEAGDFAAATRAYDAATRGSWSLRDYARVATARTLIRRGLHRAALERLDGSELPAPLAADARLLLGEAAFGAGDVALAVSTWRAHLAEPGAADAANVGLRLAAALLAPSEVAPSGSTSNGAGAPAVSVRVGSAPVSSSAGEASIAEALQLVRGVRSRYPSDRSLVARAEQLEAQALALLPLEQRARAEGLSPAEQLEAVEGLLIAGSLAEARARAQSLIRVLPRAERWGETGCAATVLLARALAGERRPGEAATTLGDFVHRCPEPGRDRLRVRALYLAGQYAARDGRHAQAIRHYQRLERESPTDRLADDARLLAARSYRALGSDARFTELLERIVEDYPQGDMVLDGVFELALHRIERGDWAGAARVLERASAVIGERDFARGTEYSGRERYWRARAWMETGERQRGLEELATLVRELPLSYYMLHAYARLRELDPALALAARAKGVAASEQEPFRIEAQPALRTPAFARASELLRVGEIAQATREIDALGVARPGTAPEIQWGIALLYARAGAPKLSHEIARHCITDWLARWPAGDWRRAWELAFPRPHLAHVAVQAGKHQIPEYLVFAVMREESAFDPAAASPAQAYGLMQLIVPTARAMAKPLGLPSSPAALRVPAVNIALGSRFLGELSRQFSANPLLAVPAYNAGPGRPRRWAAARPLSDFDIWVELIPFRETRRYTKRVLAARAAYATLYYPEEGELAMALPIELGY